MLMKVHFTIVQPYSFVGLDFTPGLLIPIQTILTLRSSLLVPSPCLIRVIDFYLVKLGTQFQHHPILLLFDSLSQDLHSCSL